MAGYWEPIPMRRPDLLVGLDLGQSVDYTGLVVVDRVQHDRALPASYDVQAIQRLPLGTSYPAVVAHVAAVIKALRETGPQPTITLIADYTGCGRPVADMLVDADLSALGAQLTLITITGADSVVRVGSGEFRVPKRDLASAILVLLQSKRIRFAEGLSLVEELTKELKGFRVKITLNGHDSYGAGEDWRSAPHDDLVLALAMACWYGETVSGAGWDSMGYSGGDLIDFFREAGVG